MLRIQFNDKKTMGQAKFKMISPSVVQLIGKKIPKSTAGFKVFQLSGELLGDYSEYTVIVAEVASGLQFGKPES